MTGHRRWRIWFLALCLLTVAAVWFVVRGWTQGFQWDHFLATFARLDPWWVTGAALVALATYYGRALRWRVLIRPQKAHPSLWNLFSATAVGFTAIVLFGRPGELVRPYLIASKEKLSFSSQIGAWLLERIYDLMMALLIFGFALSFVHSSGVAVGPRIEWVLRTGGYFVAVIGIISVVVFIFIREFGETSRRRLGEAIGFLPARYRAKIEELLNAFTMGVESTRDWLAVTKVFAYSVLEWLLIIACYYSLFRSLPDTSRFSITDILIFVGFVAFGSVVQIPGVGGGMQIVSVVVLTELFQLPLEVSSGLAIVIWIITFVVIVPFGLLLAFHDGLRWSQLRHVSIEKAPVPAGN